MEQYLLELIKTNNRVIVPNFGAFIVSRDTGTTVLFNNFLSFNDGLLINHVSSAEGIDTNAATQKVSDFVDHIKGELDKNGEYTLEKIGSFTKDQNGILRFTQDAHLASLLPEEEKETSKSDEEDLLDIDSDQPTEKDSQLKEPSKTEPSKPSPPKSEKAESDKKITAPPQTEKTKEKTKPPQPKTSTTGAQKPPEAPKRPTSESHKKGGLPTWIIILIVLIPVILIILYFLLWQDGEKTKTPEKEEKTEMVDTTPEKPAVDSAALKQAEQERLRKKEEERKKSEAEAQEATGPRHHIIVGSFKNEQNATKLVTKLKNSGFENATTFRRNNLIMVSAESYQSLGEARNAQQKILQQQKLENWILTRR